MSITRTYHINNIKEVAQYIIQTATSKTILFYGHMGAGKTTLIKSLVTELGCQDDVSSPTFSLVNEYQTDSGLVYHFDLYRIEDEEEAYNFGIEDYLSADAWIFIEWPNRLKDLLAQEISNSVVIEIENQDTRILKFNTNESQNLAEFEMYN
ncbi:tRNA (adenosine(37)-N6)-threonylcarbamoyltransferase complex ATPase subunit type 1 TsaE [Formosa sp. A9]|uniref:tRNA (adenosine(37)-N6)-threonylcarbamoyltransferase complex ATPase subunit type 1 TsaE n=1 Tax=Formosa sp. A9 TaxID=3442641 RepID=UPI003EBD0578